jgi:hypothetical protein
MVGLVDDQEVDPASNRLVGQLGTRDQRIEADDGMAMHLERVEAGAEIALDVREARLVEEHEDLVVLPPQLAEPLHGERFGQRPRGARCARARWSAIDRLDRLAEANLVGEQPAYRVLPRRLEGDVQLVWNKRMRPRGTSRCRGRARRGQVHRVG